MKKQIFFWSLVSALAGFLFGLRHRRHLRCGTKNSGALGIECRHARVRHWRGALRHRAGFTIWRLADGFFRTQENLAVHRPPLRRLCAWVVPLPTALPFLLSRALSVASASAFPRWPRRFTFRKLRRQPIADAWRACSSSTSFSASSSLLLPTRCSPASVKMPGAGCWASPRFPPSSTRCSASASRKVRAG